jgi:hypothetical protein
VAQVFQADASGCNAGWVQIHSTDAKGNAQVTERVRSWSPSTGTATAYAEADGSTLRYACVAARSSSRGTWSPTRKLGSGSGACGRP